MLDTDICIYAINGRVPVLNERLSSAAGRLCMSSVTFAELAFGIEKSQRAEANAGTLQAFKSLVPIEPFGEEAAIHYGQMRAAMEGRGKISGANDLFIGAHARSLGLTLVTNNGREFDRMPGLLVENWAA